MTARGLFLALVLALPGWAADPTPLPRPQLTLELPNPKPTGIHTTDLPRPSQ